MPQADTARWERVHERLVADSDEIVDAIVARMRVELPRYGRVPFEDLRPTTRSNLRLLFRALSERRAPSEAELVDAARVGEVRARQGIPTDEVMRGFRIVVQEVWTRERAYARDGGLDDSALLEAAQFMWEWTDLLMARSAAVHRDVELDLARHDHEERSITVLGLLHGTLTGPELEDRAAIHELSTDRAYVALRARPLDSMTAAQLERTLRDETERGPERGLVTIAGGDVIGLVARPPVLRVDTLVLAVGTPAPLATLASSYATATRLLEAAAAFGLRGLVDLGTLGLRGAVHGSTQLGDLLVARHVSPLVAEGAFGETLLLTLRTYLDAGLRIDRTAERLHVHTNTLRHRLHRYEELTGRRLDDVETLLELWWALQRVTIAG